MTNYEKIKSMTIEEMADFIGEKPFCTLGDDDCIYGWHDYDCRKHAKSWLESEAVQNENARNYSEEANLVLKDGESYDG